METRQHNQIRLAQNFIRSATLARRLVGLSTIGPSDMVYEIGPGNGIITVALASVARHVIAIEKDRDFVRQLRERFRSLDNVEIVEQDFLAYSFPTRASQYKIFANIPFNITAQILRKLLCEQSNLTEAFLILQREAAKKYSGCPKETLFSLLAKPFFEFETLFHLRRTDFRPVPNVDSVLLSITRRTHPLLEPPHGAPYRDFVRYGFGRGKPNLKLAFKHVFTYAQWKHLARGLDFPLNATATELSLAQWLELYRAFSRRRSLTRRP